MCWRQGCLPKPPSAQQAACLLQHACIQKQAACAATAQPHLATPPAAAAGPRPCRNFLFFSPNPRAGAQGGQGQGRFPQICGGYCMHMPVCSALHAVRQGILRHVPGQPAGPVAGWKCLPGGHSCTTAGSHTLKAALGSAFTHSLALFHRQYRRLVTGSIAGWYASSGASHARSRSAPSRCDQSALLVCAVTCGRRQPLRRRRCP